MTSRTILTSRFRNSLAHDGERDRRVGRSAHLADRIFKGEVLNIILINCGDNVSRLNPSLCRGRVFYRCDNLDRAVLHRHFKPNPGELASRLDLQFMKLLWI